MQPAQPLAQLPVVEVLAARPVAAPPALDARGVPVEVALDALLGGQFEQLRVTAALPVAAKSALNARGRTVEADNVLACLVAVPGGLCGRADLKMYIL